MVINGYKSRATDKTLHKTKRAEAKQQLARFPSVSGWIAPLALSELQHAFFRESPVICSVLRCAYAWVSYFLTPIGGVNAAAILPETDRALT